MKKVRPYFRKSDLFIIALVLLVSAAGFFMLFSHFSTENAKVAEIRVNTKLVDTIVLSDITTPYTKTIEGNFPVTLELSSDGVRFIDSECPDKLCIHSGLIKANQSAACLPAGVSVTVKGFENSEIDGIAG